MHEAGIARQIIDVCTGQFKAQDAARVTVVGLRVSALSSVDPEALRFCFDTLKRDTSLDAVTLQVESRSRFGCACAPTAIDLETHSPVRRWAPTITVSSRLLHSGTSRTIIRTTWAPASPSRPTTT